MYREIASVSGKKTWSAAEVYDAFNKEYDAADLFDGADGVKSEISAGFLEFDGERWIFFADGG